MLAATAATGSAVGLAGAPPATATPHLGENMCADAPMFFVASSTAKAALMRADYDTRANKYNITGPMVSPVPAFNALGMAPSYLWLGLRVPTCIVYGIRKDNSHLMVEGYDLLQRKRKFVDVGPITGLPKGAYYIGAFDPYGNYYVSKGGSTLYKIDVHKQSVTGTSHLKAPLRGGDITYYAGHFWGATKDGNIQRVDPATGAVTTFASPLPATAKGYGGAFTQTLSGLRSAEDSGQKNPKRSSKSCLGFLSSNGFLARVCVRNPGSAAPAFTLVSKQRMPSGNNVDAAGW